MTNLLRGIGYNFRGLKLGLKTPSLLALGMARLVIILLLTVVAIALILTRYEQITESMWARPHSLWPAQRACFATECHADLWRGI